MTMGNRLGGEGSAKAYSTLDKVSNTISVTFISISLLCTLFVIINLLYKKRRRNARASSSENNPLKSASSDTGSTSSQKQFTDLTQYAILCMIFSDLLMEALYLPTNLIRLVDTFSSPSGPVETVGKSSFNMGIISIITAEMTEMFVIASGIWSLFISTSIYQTVRSITEHNESIINTTRESDEEDETDDSSYGSSHFDDRVNRHSIVYSEASKGNDKRHAKKKGKHSKRLSEVTILSHRAILQQKIAYASVAWGVPLVLCTLCVIVEEKFLLGKDSTGKQLYMVNVVPDLIKSSLYFILEICTAVVRIRIFRCTQKMLSDISALLNTSPNAIRKRQEERRLLRQLSFYSLPFVLFGIWVIVYRSYEDILFTVRVVRYGFDRFSDALNGPGRILMAIHHMFSPLRGLMNAIVYVFRKQIRKMDNSIFC